jgi:hypothetical protein
MHVSAYEPSAQRAPTDDPERIAGAVGLKSVSGNRTLVDALPKYGVALRLFQTRSVNLRKAPGPDVVIVTRVGRC